MVELQTALAGGQQAQGQAPAAPVGPAPGQVIQIDSLDQLQKLVKASKGLMVNFWSLTCTECVKIKPAFEAYAKENQNPNLVFAACNTFKCKDAPAGYNVSTLPNFIAFVNGEEFKNFIGADQ